MCVCVFKHCYIYASYRGVCENWSVCVGLPRSATTMVSSYVFWGAKRDFETSDDIAKLKLEFGKDSTIDGVDNC